MRSRLVQLALVVLASASASCASPPLATFESPEEAMHALADLAGTQDLERAEQLFGPDGVALLRSGDDVADREDALGVKRSIQEKLTFEATSAERTVAVIGSDGWPFPIPLVRAGGGWSFDVEAGREELENRRIGHNELLTIATLHEFVDAQREYRSMGRDGNPPAYAQQLFSSEGRHDGLYWPVAPGEPESPLGPLVAAAAAEGYPGRAPGAGPIPFHGYFLRLLTGQGPSAPGGERSYLDERGVLSGGFALLAWPARYGNSGIMTFQVNQQGLVFQKDLGPGTASAAALITRYSPDETWDPTGD
jgi:hypothetical protein